MPGALPTRQRGKLACQSSLLTIRHADSPILWVHGTETTTALRQQRYGTAARTRIITETVAETDKDERKRNAGNQALVCCRQDGVTVTCSTQREWIPIAYWSLGRTGEVAWNAKIWKQEFEKKFLRQHICRRSCSCMDWCNLIHNDEQGFIWRYRPTPLRLHLSLRYKILAATPGHSLRVQVLDLEGGVRTVSWSPQTKLELMNTSGPFPLFRINKQHDFKGWVKINVSCYILKLDCWPCSVDIPSSPCWKIVPMRLYSSLSRYCDFLTDKDDRKPETTSTTTTSSHTLCDW